MKGKVVVTLVFTFIGLLIFSELIELLMYGLSDNSTFRSELRNSHATTFIGGIKLWALPIFATGVAIYSKDINNSSDGIDQSDRYFLIGSIVAYVFVRMVLLQYILPYDYKDVYAKQYFNLNFYIHFLLSSISVAILFASLYYVTNYKQYLRFHWAIFYGALFIGQILELTYQMVLVYLFHNNVAVDTEIYRFIILVPVCLVHIISTIAAWVDPNSRKEIIDFYS